MRRNINFYFPLGLAVILLSLWYMIAAMGGDIRYFIEFSGLMSLLAIGLPLLAMLIATGSFGVFYSGLRAVVLPDEEIPEDMRGRAASLFRVLSKTAALAAAAATLICIVNICIGISAWYSHDASRIATFGRNALALLSVPIYAMLLILAVFEPVVFLLKTRKRGR